MNVFCYVRTAHKPPMTCKEQAARIRQEAEQIGFGVINTRSTSLDSMLLDLLQNNQAKLQQAVIAFRE